MYLGNSPRPGWDRQIGVTDDLFSAVSRIFASWNQLKGWLSAVDGLRRAA